MLPAETHAHDQVRRTDQMRAARKSGLSHVQMRRRPRPAICTRAPHLGDLLLEVGHALRRVAHLRTEVAPCLHLRLAFPLLAPDRKRR
eukprot:7376089-Prymnesium_polylepis.3